MRTVLPSPLRSSVLRLLLAAGLGWIVSPVQAGGTIYVDPGDVAGLLAPVEPASDGATTAGALRNMLGDLRDAAGSMNAPFAHATTALGAWQAWRDANEALSDLDRTLDAGMAGDDSGPQVPSSCVDSEDAACAQCFQAAYDRVNFVRMTLERLRSIHSRTLRYIKAKEAFGDSVAPIHGMSGLAWQSSRAGIEQVRTSFNQSSMAKYRQLIETMEAALGDVARCEAEHFDNPDWNTRYGFMYLQAIRTAYEPVDGG